MTAFRILDQSPVFFDLEGRPAAGGSIEFYEAGTTTPKDVYGDQALNVNNGSTIAIGPDGRAVVDIWGDGSYRQRGYAADGTLISDDDDVEIPGGSGTAIPALQAGKVLSNDGAILQWLPLLQPPDPTGQGGKVLGSDGSTIVWQTPPAAPTLPPLPTGGITVGSNSITIGDALIQWGTDSAPATGAHTTTKTVNYPTPYASAPFVAVTRGGAISASGFNGTHGAQGITAAGFAATFDVNVDNSGSAFNITSDVPFVWLAVGKK